MIINKLTHGFITRSDELNSNWTGSDDYYVVDDNSSLAKKILEYAPNYELIIENETIVGVSKKVDLEQLRAQKLQELETFIYNLKEQGFMYNDNRFKLDTVAQNRINMLATNVSLTGGVGMFPLQWFTANGENGTITLNDVNDFSAWYTQATLKILEIETKEANYRYMIEQAQTEEELNNIIFE